MVVNMIGETRCASGNFRETMFESWRREKALGHLEEAAESPVEWICMAERDKSVWKQSALGLELRVSYEVMIVALPNARPKTFMDL